MVPSSNFKHIVSPPTGQWATVSQGTGTALKPNIQAVVYTAQPVSQPAFPRQKDDTVAGHRFKPPADSP